LPVYLVQSFNLITRRHRKTQIDVNVSLILAVFHFQYHFSVCLFVFCGILRSEKNKLMRLFSMHCLEIFISEMTYCIMYWVVCITLLTYLVLSSDERCVYVCTHKWSVLFQLDLLHPVWVKLYSWRLVLMIHQVSSSSQSMQSMMSVIQATRNIRSITSVSVCRVICSVTCWSVSKTNAGEKTA